MKNIFIQHPHSVGETYGQHLRIALFFGGSMLLGGIACMIHAFFPFLFSRTGSSVLFKMTHSIIERLPSVTTEERLLPIRDAINKKMNIVN